jgi:pentatricopeptide repeat protein
MSTFIDNASEGATAMLRLLKPFAQELLVLGVFLIAYALSRHLGQHTKRLSAAKKLTSWEVSATFDKDSQKRIAKRRPENKSEHQDGPRRTANEVCVRSVRVAEAQMLQHLEQQEFTRALNMFRALERDGRERCFSEELYSSFIQSAVRVGKVDVVEMFLRSMKRSGASSSLKFWQTTLKMLSSRKHFNTCLTVHTLFGQSLPCDKVIFSCFINAALESGIAQKAAAMLTRYSSCDLDIKDHVLFFRTYVVLKDVDAAEKVFHSLGNKTTTLMLNLLLLTAVNAGETDRAENILRDAHERETENGVDSAIVDVVSYNTVIKGLAQASSPSRCFNCLHEMRAHGIEPDYITFGTVLDACIVDNDMNAASEIVTFLSHSNRPMDTVTCTLFIKGLVRANCLPKALELWDEMKLNTEARPDIITYSVLIKALVDQHDLDRALSLVEDMKVAGHRPDDIVLTHLLEGCRHAGNHTLGKKLFNEMLGQGMKPSEFSLVTMLKLHGRCGAHREAHDLVSGWEATHGYKPSVIHYTCLMSGCLRTKSYDQAWAAYRLMCSNGVSPDGTTLSTLLPGMVAAQEWDRVLVLVRQALVAHLKRPVPNEIFKSALSQMQAANGFARQAEQLRNMLQVAGIPLLPRNSRKALQQ